MKKILFIYDYLAYGGISTYLINLLNSLDPAKYDISVLVTGGEEKILMQLNSNINIIKYGYMGMFSKLLRYIQQGAIVNCLKILFHNKNSVNAIRDIQKIQYVQAMYAMPLREKYDIVVGADLFWADYYALLQYNAEKKIVWIHPDYSAMKIDHELDYEVFQRATNIVTVSHACAKNFIKEQPGLRKKVVTIENIVDIERIKQLANEKIQEEYSDMLLNIITVCRLDNKSKRIDRIVKVCHELKKTGCRFTWRIIGDGKDREMIKKLIRQYSVQNELILIGKKDNPFPYVNKSDAYVLLSQYEGKPLSVTEAIVLGCPVIVTNYETASTQVDEASGYIVDNDDKTVVGMTSKLLCDVGNIRRMRRNMQNLKVNNETVLKEIDKLFLGDGDE